MCDPVSAAVAGLKVMTAMQEYRSAKAVAKGAAEFELSQEANKEEAKALNTNAGNATKIIQDIAGTQDMQFLGVIRDFDTDVFNLANQETEAYSAQERRYNSIAPVVMPSKTGLLLEVGTIGMTSYQNNKKATAPDTGEVVAP